jgi:hypothetical protein
MIVVEPLLPCHQFVGLHKPDVQVLHLHPGLNGTTPLSNVNNDHSHGGCSICPEAVGDLPGWQASTLDDVPALTLC